MLDVIVDQACHLSNQEFDEASFGRWLVLCMLLQHSSDIRTWFQNYGGESEPSAHSVGARRRSVAATRPRDTHKRGGAGASALLFRLFGHSHRRSELSRHLPPGGARYALHSCAMWSRNLNSEAESILDSREKSMTFHYSRCFLCFTRCDFMAWSRILLWCLLWWLLLRFIGFVSVLNSVKPGTSYLAHSVVWFRGIHFEGHLYFGLMNCSNVSHLAAYWLTWVWLEDLLRHCRG